MVINQRQEALITAIINHWIREAEPVSSKWLENEGFFDLKSATIRAEMNELEEKGYLSHFHTSGGRVPTDKAYRYYVNNLIEDEDIEPKPESKNKIRSALRSDTRNPRQINRAIAQVLSELSDNLVITGIAEEDDFFKIGLSSLFRLPDFRELDMIFRLTSFFDEFENIFDRNEKEFFSSLPEKPRDMRIFIGRENPVRDIRDETVMFARYDLPKGYSGTLTLIGPTRMDYQKNIGLIKYTTNELNKLAKNI